MATSFKSPDGAVASAIREMRVCEECCNFYNPWRVDQRFCKPACNRSYHSRQQSRGAVILPIAMAWRSTRGKAKDKMAEMCHVLDGWHSDDRKRREKYESAIAQLKAAKKGET